jgi:endonuclease/exonuclease/phosphatase family metal-dependent hydrolase
MRLVLVIILMSLLISGGGSKQFFEPTSVLNPISTKELIPVTDPDSNATGSTSAMIRVVSYNILFGAGVDRQYDDLLPSELKNKNRLPELLSFLQEAKPDIMGIQEANGWDRGNPVVVHQVAEELAMNYYLAEAPNDFHVVLLTRFKIAAVENLSGKEGDPISETMRALRATLLNAEGQSLNVFIVHFDPFSTRIRLCQLDSMINQLDPYKEQTTILLGDMNFSVDSLEYVALRQAGWQPVAVSTEVDQIWIPADTDLSGKPPFMLESPVSGLSDHLPVGAEFKLDPSPVGISASAPVPQLVPMPIMGCIL